MAEGSVVVNGFKFEKETKNKVRYNDFGDFGPLYVPKAWFNGKIPQELSIEAKW